MTNLDPVSDSVVRDAVDAYLDGRLAPELSGERAGETAFETKNSRYRLVDGIVISAPDDSLVGSELVGWLIESERRSVVESAWAPGSRAVLVDRHRGRNIIVTSTTRLLHVEERAPAAYAIEVDVVYGSQPPPAPAPDLAYAPEPAAYTPEPGYSIEPIEPIEPTVPGWAAYDPSDADLPLPSFEDPPEFVPRATPVPAVAAPAPAPPPQAPRWPVQHAAPVSRPGVPAPSVPRPAVTTGAPVPRPPASPIQSAASVQRRAAAIHLPPRPIGAGPTPPARPAPVTPFSTPVNTERKPWEEAGGGGAGTPQHDAAQRGLQPPASWPEPSVDDGSEASIDAPIPLVKPGVGAPLRVPRPRR